MAPSSMRHVNALHFTETRILKGFNMYEKGEEDSELPFVALYVATERNETVLEADTSIVTLIHLSMNLYASSISTLADSK
jgi:hypothetical protein